MDYEELGLWLRLTTTPGVGPHTARQLLTRFGLPEAIFAQSESVLKTVVSVNVARALKSTAPTHEGLLKNTWAWLYPAGGSPDQAVNLPPRDIITLADSRYPAALLAIEDPPVMLYCLGSLLCKPMPFPRLTQCIAIVGSRNPTAQGAENAQAFAHALCRLGLTVVSGLALGIDANAHQGAINSCADLLSESAEPAMHHSASTTIAVIGTGIDRVYPGRHIDLARNIVAQGMIVSEYPLGTPPIASNFPKRNRIISGLSQGVLVVEAALASGSLITARMATEQGRDVFAIPGSIHAPQSKGCHALIRQGAKLVESAQDILEEWPSHSSDSLTSALVGADHAEKVQVVPTIAAMPRIVLDAIGFDPVGLDQLQARTGLDTPTLQVALLELELGNYVVRLPGGVFQQVNFSG